MISGSVNARREASIRLVVAGTAGRTRFIEAAIDTAYNGSLTLPQSIINSLGMPTDGVREVKLGDGTRRACAFYRAVIVWDGVNRAVAVLHVEGQPLVGTKLLDGHVLEIEYVIGGRVTLRSLPAPPRTPAPPEVT